MKTVLFRTLNNSSQRKIRATLEENDIEYTERNIIREPLSKDEYFEIITKHEGGIEGLLSRNATKIIGELRERGVDVEELTLTEFYDIVVEYPNIFRSPILIHGNVVLSGYDADEIRVLVPKETRVAEMDELLRVSRDSDESPDSYMSKNSTKQDDESA